MFTKKLHAALIGAAVAAALALPASANAQSASKEDTVITARVSVRVVNHNYLDVRVYAVSRDRTYRLGTVGAFTTEKFKLPRWLSSPNFDIRLVAVPIGSRDSFATLPIAISPGDLIVWRVENTLGFSSVQILDG